MILGIYYLKLTVNYKNVLVTLGNIAFGWDIQNTDKKAETLNFLGSNFFHDNRKPEVVEAVQPSDKTIVKKTYQELSS